MLRVYSGSGVEGRAGAPGKHPVWGRGRAEGGPAGQTGERGAAAAASPAGATAPCAARPGIGRRHGPRPR